MKGLFITFEGTEGVGKSTQANLLKNYLEEKGFGVEHFREPGGTERGEKLRQILLKRGNSLDPLTELFLFLSSRRELVKEKIEPALKKNRVVLCDRFMDSTTAYQGYGRLIDIELIERLNSLVVGESVPHITFLLLTKNPLGFKVVAGDRIEVEDKNFHKRVREGYLEIAKKNSQRMKIIDGKETIQKVHEKIIRIVDEYLVDS